MIERTLEVPVPADALWEAVTVPDKVSRWLGGPIEWAPEEGSPLRFESPETGTREGRIETVEPGRLLRFVWWSTGEQGREEDAEPSEVTFVVEETAEGSRLVVEEQRIRWTPADDSALAEAATASALVRW